MVNMLAYFGPSQNCVLLVPHFVPLLWARLFYGPFRYKSKIEMPVGSCGTRSLSMAMGIVTI